jgi:type II secretory pathway component PulC
MAQNSLQAAAIKHRGLSFFSIGALKGRFAFFKNRFLKAKGLGQPDLKVINVVLKFCVFILAFYFVIDLSVSTINSRKDLDLTFKTKSEKVQEGDSSEVFSSLKVLSFYLEKARQRDIFKMGVKKPTAEAAVIPRGPSRAMLEATENLKLVGISWSEDPDVMIEDIKNKRTFFLKKGQTIDNEIKIQAVFKDKVILSYRGEEIELR